MDNPISNIEQVTPEWLTERLKYRNYIDQEVVVDLQLYPIKENVVRIEATYSNGLCDLSSRFVLKIRSSNPNSCADRDVRFHMEMASLMPTPPTVPWFDAAYDSDTSQAHLLSQDIGTTHYHRKVSDQTDLRADSERIVDTLSQFHAFWWNHPDLGKKFGNFPKEDNLVWGGPSGFIEGLPSFCDLLGDRLPANARSIYERALASYPFKDLHGKSRLSPGNHLTVIHQDALYDNVFFPVAPNRDSVYVIDWEFWMIRVGTDDVANFGLLGFCDPKTNLTRDLIRRYYDGLIQNGVRDYSWEDCWHDYRLSTIRNLFIPINSFRDNEYSWGNLNRSLQSFHDLDCEELLNS